MDRRTQNILAFLLLFIPWVLFYHDYLFFGNIYVAPTPHALTPGAEGAVDIRQSYQRDRSMVLYPEWTLLHFYQKTGASPYWNPYQFSGMPMVPQSSFMDPLRFFLVWLLGNLCASHTLYMLAMMLRSALALAFIFLIFRHFRIAPLRASAATLAVWFAAPILVLHHRTFDPLYFWFLILYLNLKLWSAPDLRRRMLWGLGIALVFAAEIYSWHLHFSMLFAVLLAVFNGTIAIREYRRGLSRNAVLAAFGIFAGAGILAGLIGTFRIWTFLEILGYSYRTVLPKSSGGMAPYIPFGVLYFPFTFKFQNTLELFTTVQFHPIHPELKRIIGEFDYMRIVFFPVFKTLGQIDAIYRSPVWYLVLLFTFLDRKTRRQAYPFWASYAIVFAGYNALALFSLVFRGLFPAVLQAFNWLYLVVTATHSCLAICFGFGLLGLWRTLHRCWMHARTSAGPGPLFAAVSIRTWMCVAAAALLGYGTIQIVWSAAYPQPPQFLYDLISRMANNTAPAFLSQLIKGAYPLEHYHAKLGHFWDALRPLLSYFFLVPVPVLILTARIFLTYRKAECRGQITFRLSTVLSIATIFLAGYGATYVLIGLQIHRNAAYMAEKLEEGLRSADLDPELSRNTGAHFQAALQDLYDPLPGACFLLLGVTLLGLILLWQTAHRPRRRSPALIGLALLLGTEGVLLTLHQEDRASARHLSPNADWVSFLKSRIGPARYLAFGQEERTALKTTTSQKGPGPRQIYDLSLAGLAVKKYGLLKPSTDLLLRQENLDGSSPFVSNDYRIFAYAPALLSASGELTWSALLQGRTEMAFPFYKSRSFDLLGLKYLIARQAIDDPDYRLVYENSVKIYENTRAFPRAWLVPGYDEIPDRYELLKRLSAPGFDPAQTVLLEKRPVRAPGEKTRYGWVPQIPARTGDRLAFKALGPLQRWLIDDIPVDGAPFTTGPSPEGEVHLKAFEPGRIQYQVKTQSDQMLVVSEIFYPGWQAKIDSRPADIYRANYALMAVPVGQGEHRVELYFEPRSYACTLRISLLALGVVAAAWLFLAIWPEILKSRSAFSRA